MRNFLARLAMRFRQIRCARFHVRHWEKLDERGKRKCGKCELVYYPIWGPVRVSASDKRLPL